ncbi:MAG: hypothetical protein ACREJU_07390 [Nitrospiraceae bacterium]
MNRHAEKLDLVALVNEPRAVEADLDGILHDVYGCPNCGNIEMRRAS